MLSVHLPFLPLECLRPRWSEPGLYAVIEKGRVVAASTEAMQAGVHVGMRTGGVAAVSPGTTLLERNPEKEQETLRGAAFALLQFTPEVAHGAANSLIADVSASLTLFQGRPNLCRKLRAALTAVGVTAHIGAGTTAMGAWLLSQFYTPLKNTVIRRTAKPKSLERQLNRVPCSYLPSAAPFADWLSEIGAQELGALRRLPRAGVLRRMGPAVLEDLDRAYGVAPELFNWIALPEVFSARVETLDREERAESCFEGAAALVHQLVGWLTAKQEAVSVFTLDLEHERGRSALAPTVIEVTLAEATWKAEHILRLLKERLARVELTAAVIALRLTARLTIPMAPPNQSLFPEAGGSPSDFKRLLELLTARLGSDSVLVPRHLHDHRPEACNAWSSAVHKLSSSTTTSEEEVLERPFWLLPKPIPLLMRNERPFYGSPLRMLKGPERIEAGWWNGELAVRDYYIAQGDDHSCYWVFLERIQNGRWHLHGLFG